ncbi:MAG: hypothetical protein JSV36_01710 [Anaerolineae bacterium]|nr:MAG: hypothetical protein JSV36_01710 [Anaerolineae bacterium]
MTPPELEEILDICIAQIRSGQATAEDCLQRYAGRALTLEPLLRQAVRLAALPAVGMPADAVDALERRVLRRAAEIEAERSTKRAPRRPFWLVLASQRRRLLPVALGLALALMIASTWTVSASASSLPGEALYPVKLAAEQTRLAVTFRHEARARLHLAFAARRLNEIEALLLQNRAIEAGPIDDLAAETRLVLEEIEEMSADRRDKVSVQLLTLAEQQQAVLTSVRASAPEEAQVNLSQALEASQRGRERAMEILGRMPEASPEPRHTPEPTHIRRATPTHKPTPTPKPTHTPKAKPTRKPTHTPKVIDAPQAKPTHKPTHTPKPTRTPQARKTHKAEPIHAHHDRPAHRPMRTPKPKPTHPNKGKEP